MVALRTVDLGKTYRLGASRDGAQRTLREEIVGIVSRARGPENGRTFWALRDVSLEVAEGEVVGLIGRNGAGKSTMLKILSRITEPSSGYADVYGRVGSLLEVGTGFHPELTGRENIYLNGAILGMAREEIRRRFDEIVAFAEIGPFLDTPVKRYSSGMHVRLAFAVAAHLEPEVLLVDEVLAVGDASFQAKCLGKMGDVARGGRTVLFVSHQMAAVRSLCSRAVWLEGGRVQEDGPAAAVVQSYLRAVASPTAASLESRQDRSGDGSARLLSLRIENEDGGEAIYATSRLKVAIRYRADGPLRHARFLLGVYDYTNVGLFLLDSEAAGGLPEELPAEGEVVCQTESINLTPGPCYANVALMRGTTQADYVQYAGHLDVQAEDVFASGKLPPRDWVVTVLRNAWSVG